VDGRRPSDLLSDEFLRIRAEPGLLQTSQNGSLFNSIDVAVGSRSGDHRTDQFCCFGVRDRCGGKSGAGRRRFDSCLLMVRYQGTAILVILVGLVGEAAYQSDSTNLGRVCGQGAPALGPEYECAKPAKCSACAQLVIGYQLTGSSHQFVGVLA